MLFVLGITLALLAQPVAGVLPVVPELVEPVIGRSQRQARRYQAKIDRSKK